MNKTDNALTVTDVSGPFREPRESVFSYDYAIQRPTWATPFAVRIKVALGAELDVIKNLVMGPVAGSPGQQVLLNKLLTRHIADQKLRIADNEGMLSERRDVLVEPFVGPMAHLFPQLERWVQETRETLQAEMKQKVGL
ncbi:MAG TPA: hypothetical protein VJ805_01750 [Nitrospiraceae bacterium]|nr:hypothetical protein [Nitrospiraceae bacterium]